MKQEIPFIANTRNDLRCVQAVLKMILTVEGRVKTFSELDHLTRRRLHDWTWNAPTMLAMKKLGFHGVLFEDFNYGDFSRRGTKYLNDRFGTEWTAEQAKHTSMAIQIRAASNLQKKIKFYQRDGTISDIRRLMASHYVAPVINSRALIGKKGYVGHLVLLLRIKERSILLHDPGLPPKKNLRVSLSRFRRAFTGTIMAWKPA